MNNLVLLSVLSATLTAPPAADIPTRTCVELQGDPLRLTVSQMDELAHESTITIVNSCSTEIRAAIKLVPSEESAADSTAARLSTTFSLAGRTLLTAPWNAVAVSPTTVAVLANTIQTIDLITGIRHGETALVPGTYTADFALDWIPTIDHTGPGGSPGASIGGSLPNMGFSAVIPLALAGGTVLTGTILFSRNRRRNNARSRRTE